MTDFVTPGHATVGTCSLCGGPVTVPSMWMSIIPPIPTCGSCGAVAAEYGPVLPMLPPTCHVVITTSNHIELAGRNGH